MPAIVNFGYFEVQELDNSEINMGEVVTLTPFLSLKRNDGYGFNIGEWKYVPSAAWVNDSDVFDNLRWAPNWRPVGAAGS
jgi:hypothetical protein